MPNRCPTKRMLHAAALLIVLVSVGGPAAGDDFMRGADISFLPQVETGGGVFRDGGVARDLLEILADRGIDTIRLRLWHSPGDGHSGLAEALAALDAFAPLVSAAGAPIRTGLRLTPNPFTGQTTVFLGSTAGAWRSASTSRGSRRTVRSTRRSSAARR